MQRYILRRLAQTLITIWMISVGVFMLTRLTGSPVDLLVSPMASERDRAAATRACP